MVENNLTPEELRRRRKVELRKMARKNAGQKEKDRAREASRKRRAMFPNEGRLAKAKWVSANRELSRERQRGYHYKRLYGITIEERDAMLQAQGGVCLCCQSVPTTSKTPWHVDHNHKTGAVRGILCLHCNITLGHARDNPELLRKLADYLERTP